MLFIQCCVFHSGWQSVLMPASGCLPLRVNAFPMLTGWVSSSLALNFTFGFGLSGETCCCGGCSVTMLYFRLDLCCSIYMRLAIELSCYIFNAFIQDFLFFFQVLKGALSVRHLLLILVLYVLYTHNESHQWHVCLLIHRFLCLLPARRGHTAGTLYFHRFVFKSLPGTGRRPRPRLTDPNLAEDCRHPGSYRLMHAR